MSVLLTHIVTSICLCCGIAGVATLAGPFPERAWCPGRCGVCPASLITDELFVEHCCMTHEWQRHPSREWFRSVRISAEAWPCTDEKAWQWLRSLFSTTWADARKFEASCRSKIECSPPRLDLVDSHVARIGILSGSGNTQCLYVAEHFALCLRGLAW